MRLAEIIHTTFDIKVKNADRLKFLRPPSKTCIINSLLSNLTYFQVWPNLEKI